jgi:hypothetical protein
MQCVKPFRAIVLKKPRNNRNLCMGRLSFAS